MLHLLSTALVRLLHPAGQAGGRAKQQSGMGATT
jgi:hypothetical protein